MEKICVAAYAAFDSGGEGRLACLADPKIIAIRRY
jgi:hypothetical protein